MLLIAVVLTVTGRTSRWRPHWLLLPAVTGACWLAAVRVAVAVAALEASAGRLIAAERAVASHVGLLLHPSAALAGAGWWLPRELPLALLGGTAEAAIVLWFGWRRSPPAWQPGVIALVRRRAAAAALAASHTVMAGGCAIGVDPSSGRLAGFRWAEAQGGVLLAGPDEGQLGQVGLAVACAAMRLRKTVIVIDTPAGLAGQVALLARRLGVPLTEVSLVDGDTASSIGRAIRGRCVLILPARQPEVARRAVAGLSAVLAGLRDLGLRGDCLAWVTSCDGVEPGIMTGLLELGQATGTSVLLSTTSTTHAASLAAQAGMTVDFGRTVSAERGHRVSAECGCVAPGAFTLASARSPDARVSGVLVPIRLGQAR
ncbi:MAG TPA: hypothetical protein VME44_16490 [Streptosporangiaceae bacterium]|nr:hypothetical protein [Streptosporangiaceae bacterium]